MKFKLLIFLILTFFSVFVSSHLVAAVGIQYPQGDRTIVFQPNIEKEYSFNLINAERIETYVAGDLKEYVTIIDPYPKGGPRTITVRVALPETLAPGSYNILIGAREIAPEGEGVGGLAAIQARIPVLVLYPGKSPDFNVGVPNFNVNDTVKATVTVHNWGTQGILDARATIKLIDIDTNSTIIELLTDSKPVSSNQDVALETEFDSRPFALKSGLYKAVATLTYDGILLNSTKETNFRVGTLSVFVADYTKEVVVNATNKFVIIIGSDWAGDINDIYANINFPGGLKAKTPSVDLPKSKNLEKSQATLETYWETKNLNLGLNDVEITIYYNKQSSNFKLPVNVTDGLPPIIEKPSKLQFLALDGNDIILFNYKMPFTLFLMIVLSALTIFNIAYFFVKRKTVKSDLKPPKI